MFHILCFGKFKLWTQTFITILNRGFQPFSHIWNIHIYTNVHFTKLNHFGKIPRSMLTLSWLPLFESFFSLSKKWKNFPVEIHLFDSCLQLICLIPVSKCAGIYQKAKWHAPTHTHTHFYTQMHNEEKL
jgi:hypothetical protein